ncbi:MAG TPA: flagellar hook-basal body complex protein FliE [Solirubrobacteraceae bacterium]|nr:flagellar hook-basal body complex protein FliE [Solirubrobacteraceae bacterium]
MIPAISGAVGPLGPSEWTVGGVGAVGQSPAAGTNATGGTDGSFGSALTGAINSLETTQANATTASQQLATGQLTDPTQAITSVENASLAMDLASQVRTKLADAVNTVFQTQM